MCGGVWEGGGREGGGGVNLQSVLIKIPNQTEDYIV